MGEPERNVEQPRDGDHLSVMGESDGEERQADGADQARDTEESSEEAQPVLRRSTRNRRPPDRYGTLNPTMIFECVDPLPKVCNGYWKLYIHDCYAHAYVITYNYNYICVVFQYHCCYVYEMTEAATL